MFDNAESETSKNLNALVRTAVQDAMRSAIQRMFIYVFSGFGVQLMLAMFFAGGYIKAVDRLEVDMAAVLNWKEATITQLAHLNSNMINLSSNLIDLTTLLREMQRNNRSN